MLKLLNIEEREDRFCKNDSSNVFNTFVFISKKKKDINHFNQLLIMDYQQIFPTRNFEKKKKEKESTILQNNYFLLTQLGG